MPPSSSAEAPARRSWLPALVVGLVIGLLAGALGAKALWKTPQPQAVPAKETKHSDEPAKKKEAAKPVKEAPPATPISREPAEARAAFVKSDTRRGGNWDKELGRDGYIIFNRHGAGKHESQLPEYLAECQSNGEHWIYGGSQEDSRGLKDSGNSSERGWGAEWSKDGFLISIEDSRPREPRKVVLYCADFEKKGIKQRIDFLSDDKVLHTQEVGDLENGVWFHYEVTGSVQIRVTNLEHYSVLSGIFWDSDGSKKKALRAAPDGKVQAAEGQLKPGLKAEFFDGLIGLPTEHDQPTLTKVETSLVFGTFTPAASMPGLRPWPFTGPCAAIFEGYLKVPADDDITFFVESDDGAALYLGGKKLVNNEGRHAMTEAWERAELKAGLHRLWLVYYNFGGPQGLNIHWKPKGKERTPIPAEYLFHE